MAFETSPMPPKYLQQEEALTQEFNTYISTLPKQKGWIVSHLYQHQGFWYPARYLQGVISCQKHFDPQPSDILLVTSPKSGTTWLKSVLFTLINRRCHPVDTNHPLFNTNPHDLVPFLEITLYGESPNPNLAAYRSPRLFSTHMPWVALPESVRNGSACKIVYMCRNPKDAFVSMWHFADKLKPEGNGMNSVAEAFDMFCLGINAYGPFWDHILDYWKRSQENPDRILFLKYEDMKKQPGMHVRRLAEFLDCPFGPGEEESGLVEEILELCSFEKLSSLEVNRNGELSSSGEKNSAFFRQGKAGDWKNHLTDEMVEKLDRIGEEKFKESGLVM